MIISGRTMIEQGGSLSSLRDLQKSHGKEPYSQLRKAPGNRYSPSMYKGQYRVHLDPHTAYQRCHEVCYEQFGSAQGLLEAIRDYLRMAPTKLTEETFESILCDKAPVKLQREVREIPDGSV